MDWDRAELIAYSDLALKPFEFWDELSPHDFLKMCEGFNLRFKRQMQIETRRLKVIRWAGYMFYVMNRNQKYRLLKPEDLLYIDEPKEEKIIILPTKIEMEIIKSWIKK